MVEGQGYSDSDESLQGYSGHDTDGGAIGIPGGPSGTPPSNSAFFSPASSTRMTGMGAYNEPSSVSSSYKSSIGGSYTTAANTSLMQQQQQQQPSSSYSTGNPIASASVQTGFFPSSVTGSFVHQQRTSSYQSFVQPTTVPGSRLTSFATFEPDRSPDGSAHSPNIDAPAHWRSSSFGEATQNGPGDYHQAPRTSNLTSKLAQKRADDSPVHGSFHSTAQSFSDGFTVPPPADSSDSAAFSTAPSSRRDSTGEKSLFARRKPSSSKSLQGQMSAQLEDNEREVVEKKVKVEEDDIAVEEAEEEVETRAPTGASSGAGAASSGAVPAPQPPPSSTSVASATACHSTPQALDDDVHLDIANYPVNDLLLMLTALLQKIIEANDSLHPHHYHHASQNYVSNKFTANVLAFHGRNIPAISLHSYLLRILKYCPTTNEVFLSLLVYFDRIAKRANAGEFTSPAAGVAGDGTSSTASSLLAKQVPTPSEIPATQLFVMDSYNIHRLIIAGITVSSKFFSDVFYKNSRYAKVGGLPVEELNHLELQFLLLTDFHLMIPLEVLQRYGNLLLRFWKREHEGEGAPGEGTTEGGTAEGAAEGAEEGETGAASGTSGAAGASAGDTEAAAAEATTSKDNSEGQNQNQE